MALVKTSTQQPQRDIYHIHTDHLGTPQEVSNEAGEVIWAAQYRAYGAVKRQFPNLSMNLRFMGQYFDQETGLHYNRHRYYDPECGQFTTQDPIGLMGGLNNYQYVPNPVSWVDPLGLCEEYANNSEKTFTGSLSAMEANAPHVEKGNRPPYADGTRARDIVLRRERAFVRVHGENNQARSWMMRSHEIEGLTDQQIKDKFALPELPRFVSDVHVPAHTKIRVGVVGKQTDWGRGGGIQYELLQRLPSTAFKNMRPLP